ncbi:sugar kinase [Yinghuangia seranimata]|uniref:sugar kinase n=1 Tax=Yinghuangia seranimata TaxID=408067 RepID=UPI00248AEF69|nr:sugar kinase [Yinghuangia seranimata]MDI2132806.1 sugar kinase [Yinghuangia seranimata]
MNNTHAGAAQVVTLGETMVLLCTPHIGPLRHARSLDVAVGGAESNLAVGLTRLGVPTAWVGRVGDDEFGRLVTAVLAGEGVDITGAVVDPGASTGLMVKARRTSTATQVHYYRAGSAGSRLAVGDLPGEAIRGCRLLHVTGITPALSASARDAVDAAVAMSGGLVSLDLNYRAALWPPEEAAPVLRGLVARADVVFATEEEARLVLGPGHTATPPHALAHALAALGPAQVLLKRGARGAVAVVGGVAYDAPVHRVAAVDPVGAGDAFAAGYLAELLAGADVPARLATAAAAGAFAVTVPGDWEGLPRRPELELLHRVDAEEAVLR